MDMRTRARQSEVHSLMVKVASHYEATIVRGDKATAKRRAEAAFANVELTLRLLRKSPLKKEVDA